MKRRLTLFDLMVLVAATALGLGMARLYMMDYQAPSPYRFLDWLRGPPSCIAFALAIALAGLRLCRPRPKLSRVLQQPGFVASASVILGALIGISFRTAHSFLPLDFGNGCDGSTVQLLLAWCNWPDPFRRSRSLVDAPCLRPLEGRAKLDRPFWSNDWVVFHRVRCIGCDSALRRASVSVSAMSDRPLESVRLPLRCWLASPLFIALVLAVVIWTDGEFIRTHDLDRWSWDDSYGRRVVTQLWIQRLFQDAICILTIVGLWLVLGVRWRSIRQSGWVSPGHMVIIICVIAFVLFAVRESVWWFAGNPTRLSGLWLRTGNRGAMAILAAWTLLKVAGAWRLGAESADRFGRALGWCWLAVAFIWLSTWAMLS